LERRRYNNQFKRKIALWLLEEGRKVKMEEVAKRLQVTKRTLRSWKLKAKKDCSSRSGRPAYSSKIRLRSFILVAKEMNKQGYPGSPTIHKALQGKVPLRLVREYVRKIKKSRCKKLEGIRLKNRVSVDVKYNHVVWAQDGTFLGRDYGKAVEAQVIKDRCSQKVIAISTGHAASGAEVVDLMRKIKKTRPLPLVWITDNGPAYLSKEVSDYVSNEKVVHLKSIPHVPQHNGSAERMMRELKNLSSLGRGNKVHEINSAHSEIVMRADKINKNRLRASLGFKTSDRVDEESLKIELEKCRLNLFKEYQAELEKLCAEMDLRKKRKKEREVVFSLLRKNGLIKITRGGLECVT
jgi:transposase InsO family protein